MSAKAPLSTKEEKVKQRREDLLATAENVILTFDYIRADLGISYATFYRGPRQQMPIVQISARRFGVRRSDYEAWKVARLRPAVDAA